MREVTCTMKEVLKNDYAGYWPSCFEHSIEQGSSSPIPPDPLSPQNIWQQLFLKSSFIKKYISIPIPRSGRYKFQGAGGPWRPFWNKKMNLHVKWNFLRKVRTNITNQKVLTGYPGSPPGVQLYICANNKPNICLLIIEKTICTINYLNCKHKIKNRIIEM